MIISWKIYVGVLGIEERCGRGRVCGIDFGFSEMHRRER